MEENSFKKVPSGVIINFRLAPKIICKGANI
jgi:hypothetical protein